MTVSSNAIYGNLDEIHTSSNNARLLYIYGDLDGIHTSSNNARLLYIYGDL